MSGAWQRIVDYEPSRGMRWCIGIYFAITALGAYTTRHWLSVAYLTFCSVAFGPKMPASWPAWAWRTWTRARFRLGLWILGDGWLGVVTRHTLIAQRARDCITPEGRVILARCEPLSDALYADLGDGDWTLTAKPVNAREVTR